MADSDSDLEVIEVLPNHRASSGRLSQVPEVEEDDDELLDIDDEDDYIKNCRTLRSPYGFSGKSKSAAKKEVTKKSTTSTTDALPKYRSSPDRLSPDGLDFYDKLIDLSDEDDIKEVKPSSYYGFGGKSRSPPIKGSKDSTVTCKKDDVLPNYRSAPGRLSPQVLDDDELLDVGDDDDYITKNRSKTPSPTSYRVGGKSKSKSSAKKETKKKAASNGKPPKIVKEKAVAPPSSKASSASTVPPPPSTEAQGPGRQKPPKDILKMIVLQIAENVLSDEIAAKLIEKEIQFKILDSPAVENSILFEHNVPYKQVEKDFQVHEKILKEIDANILIVFNVEQHLELLQGELDRLDKSASERSKSLTDWIQEITGKDPVKKITLLIHGLEAYLRKIQRAVQKEYRDRVLKGDNPDDGKKKRKRNANQGIKLSRYEVQNALISTQLETHMNYRYYENSSDLVLLLTQYAKSVGEAPYKQEKMKSTDFDWYAVADAVGGIPVEENGQGMRSLWLAQLQQFPKVGQESALAIARRYGSPIELYQAYRRCSSVEEGKNLLTNIQVTMGVGPLAKTRRLGPEASKKIYRFFTATDGEREIDG